MTVPSPRADPDPLVDADVDVEQRGGQLEPPADTLSARGAASPSPSGQASFEPVDDVQRTARPNVATCGLNRPAPASSCSSGNAPSSGQRSGQSRDQPEPRSPSTARTRRPGRRSRRPTATSPSGPPGRAAARSCEARRATRHPAVGRRRGCRATAAATSAVGAAATSCRVPPRCDLQRRAEMWVAAPDRADRDIGMASATAPASGAGRCVPFGTTRHT